MIKSWYLHVREETMAPARMISFIEKHAASCDICQSDPDLKEEIIKITELVLPESKIPKAVRQKSSLGDDEDDEVEDADDDVDSTDDTDVDDDTDDSDESDEDTDSDDDDEDLDLDDDLSDEDDEI